MAASAAFALAAQTDEIDAANGATRFGSIGILATFNVSENIIEIASTKAPKKNPDVTNKFKQNMSVKDEIRAVNGDLEIKFIGVWDTVSALGFPKDWSIALDLLFTLADHLFDIFIPHNYYNYQLNANVENVYHAIAIWITVAITCARLRSEQKCVSFVVNCSNANNLTNVIECARFSDCPTRFCGNHGAV